MNARRHSSPDHCARDVGLQVIYPARHGPDWLKNRPFSLLCKRLLLNPYMADLAKPLPEIAA
jgi:hypothetical protein